MVRPFTEAIIQRRLKQGRGTGEGKDFIPWLTIRDVPSRGVSSQPYSHKTQRIHHLLSKREFRGFIRAEWRDDVQDIREQFPLPREETRDIARDLGVRHPTAPGGVEIVMTLDLRLTITVSGARKESVWCVKGEEDLKDARTISKLEIERQWCVRHELEWRLVTDRELAIPFVENLAWIRPCHTLVDQTVAAVAASVAERLFTEIDRQPGVPLSTISSGVDAAFSHRAGTALTVFRHLLARKHWELPMDTLIDPQRPIRGLAQVRKA